MQSFVLAKIAAMAKIAEVRDTNNAFSFINVFCLLHQSTGKIYIYPALCSELVYCISFYGILCFLCPSCTLFKYTYMLKYF